MNGHTARPRIRILPPVYLLMAILSMIALDWQLPLAQWVHHPWTWLGAPLIVLGLVPAVSINAIFRKRGTTIRPFHESSTLVTEGFFRYSRNPIYVGMVMALIGVALSLGSASPWVVIPVFAIIIDVLVIRVEERMLRVTFGEQYVDYQSRVRRWL